jgi:hypothetical protein
MVLRMKREFVASNEALEAAKTEMERLYASSVSENTLSFIVNDSTVSYSGDDYEQVLVHLYMALNYLELAQYGEARVEALQVDAKLREIGEKFPENKFTEDAFSRYLTGLIYEERGEWSDAMIAYRKAYEAYKKYHTDFGLGMPTMLKYDLLRMSKRQGLKDEAAEYRSEFDISSKQQQEAESPAGSGELVFILNNGLAPIKREKSIDSLDATSGRWVRIALPYYESRTNNVVGARISASGKQVATEPMEDIDAIARKSLDARMPAIVARSVARAVVKVVARSSMDKREDRNGDPLVGLLGMLVVDVAAVATERSDTRSWLTLPANIQMARLALPPGRYTIKADLLDVNGETVATREYPEVQIAQAHKTYLTQQWIPPQLPANRSEK